MTCIANWDDNHTVSSNLFMQLSPSIADLCSAEEVKGFPTLKLYVKGRFLSEYSGERTAKAFLDFVTNAPTGKKEEL